MRSRYQLARNPHDRLWYVIGFCGGRYWMTVSVGYRTRKEAADRLRLNRLADADLSGLLSI